MKNIKLALLTVASAMLFSSCTPPNIPDIQQIAPNETAFLVPLEGNREKQVKFDSEEFLEKNKISVGRIEIPKRWRQTSYPWMYWVGEYIPELVLIKVDRAPVTVQWQASVDTNGRPIRKSGDKSIWIESQDSVGFSVGFNVSAFIEAQNASKFLYIYAGRSLQDVMDTEVHGRVMEVAQTFSAKQKMDKLREMKGEMSESIQMDVKKFFTERGITITNIGMFGGFVYENEQIQGAIDGVFVAQQEKNKNLAMFEAQDSINQKMLSEAQAKAEAFQKEAEGKAAAYKLEASGKAEAITLEAKALQEAQSNPLYIEMQRLNVTREFNTRWDGKLPQSYIGTDNVTTLMGIPSLKAVQ
jgi:hypothetical protein